MHGHGHTALPLAFTRDLIAEQNAHMLIRIRLPDATQNRRFATLSQ